MARSGERPPRLRRGAPCGPPANGLLPRGRGHAGVAPSPRTGPPCFSELGPKRFAAKLAASLTAHEALLREDNAAKEMTVLGRKAVLEQDPFDRPKSFDPRRALNPGVACKDRWRRIEALARRKELLEAYRKAWESFKEGQKDSVFPEGTYWMCRHAGCACTPPG